MLGGGEATTGETAEVIKIWELAKTPIKVQNLEILLKKYPKIEVADELLKGFKFGFRLGYTGPRLGGESENLKSVLQYPDKTKEKILNEQKLGRIAGPFKNKPIVNLKISPIGIIPKAEGLWSLITHILSRK